MAIASAAGALAAEVGDGTWLDIAQRACVGARAARETVKNMVKAGELCKTGSIRVPGSRRPMAKYAPPRESWVRDGMSLDKVLRSWSRS